MAVTFKKIDARTCAMFVPNPQRADDDPDRPISVQINGEKFERLTIEQANALAEALRDLAALALEALATKTINGRAS